MLSEAKAVESHLKAQQRNILRLALRICKQITNVPTEVKNAKIETIDIKFTRNRSDNLIIKTQSLKNMLDVGVHPLLAFKLCGLFDDPQKAYELSKNSLEEAKRNLNKGISQNNGRRTHNIREKALTRETKVGRLKKKLTKKTKKIKFRV